MSIRSSRVLRGGPKDSAPSPSRLELHFTIARIYQPADFIFRTRRDSTIRPTPPREITETGPELNPPSQARALAVLPLLTMLTTSGTGRVGV